jgi:tRNA G18 (ribose-2'-O)-methylase SpoU
VIHRAHADDPRLEPYRCVGDPLWLLDRQIFVAEGRLVVERLLASPQYAVESVAVTATAYAALRSTLEAAPCDVYVTDLTALERVTGFNFHRGCLALARRPAERGLAGVGNPDNVGGIFRTAAALGAAGILLDPTSGDPLYRKAIRTSMGAALTLPWVRAAEWAETLAALQRAGFSVVALTPEPSATPIADVARGIGQAERLAIVLGAEGPGLSERTLQQADVRVRIPIVPAVDSLNVVVAAALALDRLR